MILRFFTILLIASALAPAQIAINNHATGAALSNPYVLPDAAVDDSEQLQIDIVNTGTDTVTVNSAVVFGQYYSLCCATSFTLAPAAIQPLTLTFNPQGVGYRSGSLQIDSQAVLLFARAVPAASLFIQTAAGTVQAHSGTPLAFTSDTSSGAQVTCVLQDDWSGPVTVNSISVTGNWTLGSVPLTPLLLQEGNQISFTLTAAGASPDGSVEGVLSIDQWTYAIVAQPSQPTPQIQIPSPLLKSGEQSSIAIQFNRVPAVAAKGTVHLTFAALVPGTLQDPAIIFPSTGTAIVDFTSVPGQLAASFDGAASVTFQTGTTEGTIQIEAEWENAKVNTPVHITAEPVAIENISTERESNALDVSVTGYDNTRTAGRLSFSFFDSQGAFIGNPVTADFTEIFNAYFFQIAYNAGGMFKMTARFPVTGNVTQISAVQVDLINSAGDAQSSVTRF